MKKILLISIGTGLEVENGIKVAIENHKPEFIFFFCTKKSIETVEKRLFGLYEDLFPYPYKIVKLNDPNNHEEIYKKAAETIYNVWVKIPKCQIIVDYTSGTKAMSVGIALAANDIAPNISKLSYVMGNLRDPNFGRVITGNETVKRNITPQSKYRKRSFDIAKNFFDEENFIEAQKVFHLSAKSNPIKKEKQLSRFLERLSKVYHHWHLWEFEKANYDFEKLFNDFSIKNKKLQNQKKIISVLTVINDDDIAFYDILSENDEAVYYMLINLYRDAESHRKAGEYKRAVLYYYRIIELAAQYKLAKNGINSEEVPISLLEKYHIYYVNTLNSNTMPIGCFNMWQLSLKLGYFTGLNINLNELRDILDIRNHLYFIHGKNNPRKEQIKMMKDFVEKLFDYMFEDWKNMYKHFEYLKIKEI